MKRVIERLAAMVIVGFAVSLAAVTNARASDIVCKSPAGGSPVHCDDSQGAGMRCSLDTDGSRARTHQRHLICESATLSARYERIYAEQQRMLRKGTIQDADVAAWRVRRDACDSARCLESMFSRFWRDRDAMRNAPGRPVPRPPAAAAMSDSASPGPASAAAPTKHAQEAPTSAEPHAAQVRPLPNESARPTATPSQAPAAPAVAKHIDSSPGKRHSAALAVESLLSGLAVLGMGAGFLWTRRAARAKDGPPSAIPPAMTIAYGLLLVNALLLPFTLGLK
ncbi:hypothetical protein LMG31506_03401 [Cupriavidus yeoncheonensis]|uniref:GntR family transcriptional regulator n=1 Tax=Cupriavidus yeoncheonensis TaxID=1462994 RepID=A0A916IVJ6_9BURK|nr:GntR family transcriptional regulator [Cupriavidus yeoncheonensis]CAG2146397.1 hypothetical protein LMG31506_03401 [Cupriavidus yeoncheonensis]